MTNSTNHSGTQAGTATEAQPAITPGALELTHEAADSLMRDLLGARAILRAVILAEAAVADQSINWGPGDGGPGRWSPVMSEVCVRFKRVREIVMNTVGFTNIDWPTFLRWAEAIDAALWHGYSCNSHETFDSDELVAALRALVSMVEDALTVCVSEGIPERAAMH